LTDFHFCNENGRKVPSTNLVFVLSPAEKRRSAIRKLHCKNLTMNEGQLWAVRDKGVGDLASEHAAVDLMAAESPSLTNAASSAKVRFPIAPVF
jgi:hypothetical protein